MEKKLKRWFETRLRRIPSYQTCNPVSRVAMCAENRLVLTWDYLNRRTDRGNAQFDRKLSIAFGKFLFCKRKTLCLRAKRPITNATPKQIYEFHYLPHYLQYYLPHYLQYYTKAFTYYTRPVTKDRGTYYPNMRHLIRHCSKPYSHTNEKQHTDIYLRTGPWSSKWPGS